MAEANDIIKIISMFGDLKYNGRVGVVKWIDDLGQLHGTWGVCAIIPEVDVYDNISERRRSEGN